MRQYVLAALVLACILFIAPSHAQFFDDHDSISGDTLSFASFGSFGSRHGSFASLDFTTDTLTSDKRTNTFSELVIGFFVTQDLEHSSAAPTVYLSGGAAMAGILLAINAY